MNRNAVIMAAGMSTRFVPLSKEIPKSLIKVKGEILIERQIRQLHEAGIREIIVVVGYLKEQFEYLKEKFGVNIVENPVYMNKNNHSTLYVVRQYLNNTFICSGDNYFTENVFSKESKVSYYASVFEEGDTKEWCLHTDENGKIQNVIIGGNDAWVMKGHAYFTEDFSKKLVPYLEETYANEELADKFWEEVYMEHMDEMSMHIRKYAPGIIEEFDSIEELREFDQEYKNCSGSEILRKLSQEFGCCEEELTKMRPVKHNAEVIGFTFYYREKQYQYSFETASVSVQEV